MRLPDERFHSRVVAALGSVVLCLGTLAAHGQQELPAIRHVAPEVAARGDITTVRVEGTLPSGFWLRREPRVRVTDASGTVVELLPILRGPPPQIKGYRGVTTGYYVPGVYQVRAELDYFDPDGAPGAAVSPWTTLTVPPPGAEERPTVRHAAPVLASPGRDTTVTLEFTLPPGYELLGGPRVVAINEESALVVLLSTYIPRHRRTERDIGSSVRGTIRPAPTASARRSIPSIPTAIRPLRCLPGRRSRCRHRLWPISRHPAARRV